MEPLLHDVHRTEEECRVTGVVSMEGRVKEVSRVCAQNVVNGLNCKRSKIQPSGVGNLVTAGPPKWNP